ncbi:hypothetical protein WDU94_006106 [Cyamophila willieti]
MLNAHVRFYNKCSQLLFSQNVAVSNSIMKCAKGVVQHFRRYHSIGISDSISLSFLSVLSLAGMSRSVTIAIAYIMSVTSLNWKEALKVVRVGRSIANPNNGFQKQLQDFECFRLMDERKRLRERFPSRALSSLDEEQCQLLLIAYQSLLSGRHICEGNCAMGEICPTGMCRAARSRSTRRKTSSTSLQNFPSSSSSSPTRNLTRSNSTLSSPKRRPSSSPARGQLSGGSAPASPKSSVLDLSVYPDPYPRGQSLLASLSTPGSSSAPPSPHPRMSANQKALRKMSTHLS